MCPRTREFRALPVALPPPDLLGSGGMVLMKYSGLSTVKENGSYPGMSTKTRYAFGLDRIRGYVDRRDVPGLLGCFEDGKPVFEVAA